MQQKTCFVIIGFGVKTDYSTGREIDLDKTYKNIIEPVFTELGFLCFRASDIKHSGMIDLPMYESILKADFVLADLTTLNPNVLYELGVRHAVRKNTTLIISDKQLKYPFDLSHIIIDSYEHLGKAIDYDEVLRFKKVLSDKVKKLVETPQIDSPIYTVFPNLNVPTFSAEEIKEITDSKDDGNSLSDILAKAEQAKDSSDFRLAMSLLEKAAQLTQANDFILQRLALVTYKAELPNPIEALFRAELTLADLDPENSTNIETLGLCGAINKRLFERLREEIYLDKALWYYEKGFYIGNDYYNGINAAFLNTLKSTLAEDKFEAFANFGNGNILRKRVIEICTTHIESKIWNERDDREWVYLTLAECYFALGDKIMEASSIQNSTQFSKGDFAINSYYEQREKLNLSISLFKNKFNF